MFGERFHFSGRWEGVVTAAAAWCATPDEKRRAMSPSRATWVIADLDRETSRGDLIALFHMATGLDPYDPVRMPDEALLDEIRFAFEAGRIILLEGRALGESHSRPEAISKDEAMPEAALVRSVMGRRAEIPFEGRRYRFVTARVWSAETRRNDFQVVRLSEARDIVARMWAQPTGNSLQGRSVAEELGPQLSEGHTDTGIVLLLLRSGGGGALRRTDEPAVTPSQIREALALGKAPSEKLSFFLARFVDEVGQPISGLDVSFNVCGNAMAATTGGDGIARVDGVPAGVATAELLSISAAKATLKPRWDAPRGAATVQAKEDTIVCRVHEKVPPLDLVSEQLRTVSLQPFVEQARIFGGFFDSNKSFVLPSAIPALRGVVQVQSNHRDCKLLLVGHTDTTGKPTYNDAVSLERADATAAYLTGSVDAWFKWYGAGIAKEKRWGKREDLAMIDALPDAGDRDASENPVRWFQRTRGLEVDDIAGEQTRRALIAAYMALEGTSLPPGTDIVTHGCGENFPVDDTGDGVSALDNRRVELFLFDDRLGVQPAVPGKNSATGSPMYPEWVARAGTPFDFSTAQEPVRLALEWSEDLVDLLPDDTSVVLSGDGVDPQKHLLGVAARSDGVARIVFEGLLPDQRLTVTVKQGARELALFTDQLLGHLDDPFAWDHDLLELLLPPDVEDQDLEPVGTMPDDVETDQPPAAAAIAGDVPAANIVNPA